MDFFQGVEVEVTSDCQILPLYDDPAAPDIQNSRKRQRYIEATTGAKFEIKVTLTETFDFGQSQVASVVITPDGKNGWRKWINKSSWLLSHNESMVFSGIREFCSVSSTWKRMNYTFGSLDIAESANVEIYPAQLNALGQILLKIQRVNHKIRRILIPPNKVRSSQVTEVSEKTLKGSAISNIVSFSDGMLVAQPADDEFEQVKIPGPLGERGFLKLLYRSKRVLQMLGCLPRTPSPEAEPTPSINNMTGATSHNPNILEGLKDREQEISELRARLALLEGIENVKSEFPHTAGRVKRERDEDNQSQSSSKRSRKSGRVETIDLTDD